MKEKVKLSSSFEVERESDHKESQKSIVSHKTYVSMLLHDMQIGKRTIAKKNERVRKLPSGTTVVIGQRPKRNSGTNKRGDKSDSKSINSGAAVFQNLYTKNQTQVTSFA